MGLDAEDLEMRGSCDRGDEKIVEIGDQIDRYGRMTEC